MSKAIITSHDDIIEDSYFDVYFSEACNGKWNEDLVEAGLIQVEPMHKTIYIDRELIETEPEISADGMSYEGFWDQAERLATAYSMSTNLPSWWGHSHWRFADYELIHCLPEITLEEALRYAGPKPTKVIVNL